MLKMRAALVGMMHSKTVLSSVYILNTQNGEGEPDLIGVTVGQVGADFVVFNQVGSSAGNLTCMVPISKINAIEY
ncbi:hypothetical protein [Guptibacillus hwajinpoensis]|uniref:Uncharacterized protein n=1 Tax=Guptibacillus hwajinpoensis TaxID=208199 RepID=A0A0J6CRD8_9BACL|nr:hypothetical protein [Alkalihalobacillus macyae]KMM38871.1 hypothetical protein AB986_06325 [Alkalihalobacillus macyae]